MREDIKKKIVENGVKNLKEFGYPECNTKNIMTDEVYKEFFKSMLKDNQNQGIDEELESIIKDMDEKEIGK